jgi:hypothetical protein
MAAKTELAESGGFELPLERRETTTSPRLRLARCAVGYSSPRRPRRSRRHPMNHPTMNTVPTKATTTPILQPEGSCLTPTSRAFKRDLDLTHPP